MSPVSTPLLDRVRTPADLRNFSPEQLRQLADELRAETIDAVSVTGGHLGSSLGVVELTVAIHAIFDTPRDRLLWDVGHQAYPHKMPTGRRARIRSLLQGGRLTGLTRRAQRGRIDVRAVAHHPGHADLAQPRQQRRQVEARVLQIDDHARRRRLPGQAQQARRVAGRGHD